MKYWQWMTATFIAAFTMVITAITFAEGYIDKRIEVRVAEPMALIDTIRARLDRIENKIDRLLQKDGTR